MRITEPARCGRYAAGGGGEPRHYSTRGGAAPESENENENEEPRAGHDKPEERAYFEEIANKATILSELDQALGPFPSPSLEDNDD
jgi:hypothetical protein